MEKDLKKEWYVVNTVTGYEYKVKEKLERRIDSMELQENIFRVIVPEQKVLEVKDNKQVEKTKKMFPGYVLVEMVMSDEAWYIIRNTQGVTGFIGSSGKGAKPFPLNNDEVDKILKSMGMNRNEVEVTFKEKDKVRLNDGPFSGMEGSIESINLENNKVIVLIDLFGQITSVEVEINQVSKIS